MEIYITYLLQILIFSSRFGGFELKIFLGRSTMVADNISWFVAPPIIFFISMGLNLRDTK